jgi:anti-sigma factor RsiW
MDQVITDEDIQAFVDGELGDDEARRLIAVIALSPEHMSRYKELVRQKSLLKKWWRDARKDH